jgi:hypothetical protein
MSSNPAHGDVYSMQHDITEILLKVALNTITLSIESSEGKETLFFWKWNSLGVIVLNFGHFGLVFVAI